MRKRIESFGYAIKGFRLVLKSEPNMRIHVMAAILAIILSWLLSIEPYEWLMIVVCISIVIAAEIGNTVVEKYLDLYYPEQNPNIGALKDMSAASVLVLAVASAIVGCIIFIPKILNLL